jgi:hypothetical protein
MNKLYQFSLVLLVLLIGICKKASAQSEMTLPMMEHVYQASYYNAAAISDHKFSLGLPVLSSINFSVINTGFAFNDITTSVDGKQKWNVNYLRNNLKQNNFLHFGFRTDLLHLRIKWRNAFVFADAGINTEMYFNYDQNLTRFITFDWTEPNGDGRVFNFNNVGGRLLSYSHYSIGMARTYDKFDFGVRVKLLDGIAAGVLDIDNLSIGFNPNTYDISVTNSATVYSSGFNTIQKKPSSVISQRFKNIGFATDLAFTYKITPKFKVNIAANNLGFINWKNDISVETLSNDPSTRPFRGIDLLGRYVSGDVSTNIGLQDSLVNYLSPKSDSTNKVKSFRTNLIPNFYLTVSYTVLPNLLLSGAVRMDYYQTARFAYMIGAQLKLGKFISLTGSGNYQFDRLNFGAGFVLKPGPFQIYLVSDNLFTPLYKVGSAYAPLDARALTIRTGMNIVLGKIRPLRKQPLNY